MKLVLNWDDVRAEYDVTRLSIDQDKGRLPKISFRREGQDFGQAVMVGTDRPTEIVVRFIDDE